MKQMINKETADVVLIFKANDYIDIQLSIEVLSIMSCDSSTHVSSVISVKFNKNCSERIERNLNGPKKTGVHIDI
jgi:hypothetical protein